MEKEKDDSIHNKLKDLGLELPKQLQIPSGIKTLHQLGYALEEIKHMFQVMVLKILMALLQDLLER
jgi:hypothetical protein